MQNPGATHQNTKIRMGAAQKLNFGHFRRPWFSASCGHFKIRNMKTHCPRSSGHFALRHQNMPASHHLNPEGGAIDKRPKLCFEVPHFHHGAPGRRRIFRAPVAITGALLNPTKHCKNQGFLASDVARPIFERMPGSIIERWKRKKAAHIRTRQQYIYRDIYICIEIHPGELPHCSPLPRFRVTPLPTWELPHYPRHCKNRYLANFGPVLCSAVSEIVWVLVMVFLNMQVGGLKTARFRHRGWSWFLEVEFWCRGANNKTL